MASIIKTDNIQKVSDDSNIIKKCGSTITIGSSGASVALACGATQTGFGRSGSVNWCTTAKTSPFTAENGKGYFINTTSGAVTVTLPASPSAGDIVAVQDYANTAATNNITVGRNSSKIDGTCVDGTISVNGEAYTLVYVDGTEGWKTVNNASQQLDTEGFVAATGGDAVLTCGNFKIHVFTSTGALCVSNAGNPSGSNSVEYMIVGGGGGGGRGGPGFVGGGGGGAGGWRASSGASASGPFTAGPAPLVGCVANIPVSVQPYPVTVGAGGAQSPASSRGSKGNDSVFSTITSAGGGGGGGGPSPTAPGENGGSGGGGSTINTPGTTTQPGGTGNTPPVSPAQGNNGGFGQCNAGSFAAGGGGGGATTTGCDSSSNSGGIGGTGAGTGIVPNSHPAFPSYGAPGPCAALRYYGAGGGGSGIGVRCAPIGGGGTGGNRWPSSSPTITPATAATANTGGGGGAGTFNACASAGASGVVIIRYKYQ